MKIIEEKLAQVSILIDDLRRGKNVTIKTIEKQGITSSSYYRFVNGDSGGIKLTNYYKLLVLLAITPQEVEMLAEIGRPQYYDLLRTFQESFPEMDDITFEQFIKQAEKNVREYDTLGDKYVFWYIMILYYDRQGMNKELYETVSEVSDFLQDLEYWNQLELILAITLTSYISYRQTYLLFAKIEKVIEASVSAGVDYTTLVDQLYLSVLFSAFSSNRIEYFEEIYIKFMARNVGKENVRFMCWQRLCRASKDYLHGDREDALTVFEKYRVFITGFLPEDKQSTIIDFINLWELNLKKFEQTITPKGIFKF
ncbi:MAG: hypothetical protein GX453_03120 [Lactococcus chungangensis]|jgi:hypothetical protein|uniref:Transcriptional regulator n=1 Tax=Pseudolactococcus chungangensis TaxID=451457 RepID=A0A847J341_9LACT|nr:hypothetical protein [Lactococcus chungangensis]NLH35010.1 hypothetical protein [Lactococcus chungangensis]